jgi:putative flavoprotein involved in K+ transport
MDAHEHTESVDTLIIGAGQAGLAAGYHLSRRGVPITILESAPRVGDGWRARWDSLRLFTPARYSSLPGMPFPSPPHYFPTKDEFADYLESYAASFELPVRTGVRVDAVTREGDGYVVTAGVRRFEARRVVVAMANYQTPFVPPFASDLADDIVQIHSSAYLNPGQLRAGGVLIVGAGNSGSEIAMELAPRHAVWLSGRSVGELPFRPSSRVGRLLVPVVLRGLFHRVLTVDTPIGRKARPKIVSRGGPLIRVKRRDLEAVGVRQVPRTVSADGGRPVLEDGSAPDVTNVVWCTGFRPGFESWIRLPIHGSHEPLHQRGRVAGVPGLYFLGLHFRRALSSAMIHGVGHDAEEIAREIASEIGREAAREAARENARENAPDAANGTARAGVTQHAGPARERTPRPQRQIAN